MSVPHPPSATASSPCAFTVFSPHVLQELSRASLLETDTSRRSLSDQNIDIVYWVRLFEKTLTVRAADDPVAPVIHPSRDVFVTHVRKLPAGISTSPGLEISPLSVLWFFVFRTRPPSSYFDCDRLFVSKAAAMGFAVSYKARRSDVDDRPDRNYAPFPYLDCPATQAFHRGRRAGAYCARVLHNYQWSCLRVPELFEKESSDEV